MFLILQMEELFYYYYCRKSWQHAFEKLINQINQLDSNVIDSSNSYFCEKYAIEYWHCNYLLLGDQLVCEIGSYAEWKYIWKLLLYSCKSQLFHWIHLILHSYVTRWKHLQRQSDHYVFLLQGLTSTISFFYEKKIKKTKLYNLADRPKWLHYFVERHRYTNDVQRLKLHRWTGWISDRNLKLSMIKSSGTLFTSWSKVVKPVLDIQIGNQQIPLTLWSLV